MEIDSNSRNEAALTNQSSTNRDSNVQAPSSQSQDTSQAKDGQLRWQNEIDLKKFDDASRTLLRLAHKETDDLGKKKTLLSLSKLAGLVSGDHDLAPIDEQLAELFNQEAGHDEPEHTH